MDIISLFKEHLPFWVIVAILLIVGIVLLNNYIRDKIRTVGESKERIDTIEAHIVSIDSNIEKINNLLTTVKTFLVAEIDKAKDVFSMKLSPRRLNPLGKEIYDEIKGERFLDENQDYFFARIEKKEPKTALDVETASLEVLISASENDDRFIPLKNFVYNYPSKRKDDGTIITISLSDICFVLSLPLRDRYLKAHPEINPEDFLD
ncbi:MAG: hypothetical protein LIO85_09815 [Rikenellaceae bacterium]|nr:hypothetical protein [Rikenellaceae bacterium]